jgi:DNA-damage-inducible protein J
MMESRKGGHIMNVKPLDYSTLTKEQFDAEIEKGIVDIKAGRVYSADEVEKEMKELMK